MDIKIKPVMQMTKIDVESFRFEDEDSDIPRAEAISAILLSVILIDLSAASLVRTRLSIRRLYCV